MNAFPSEIFFPVCVAAGAACGWAAVSVPVREAPLSARAAARRRAVAMISSSETARPRRGEVPTANSAVEIAGSKLVRMTVTGWGTAAKMKKNTAASA